MKVKLKSTGEIINIASYDEVVLDCCDSYGSPMRVNYEDIEKFISEDEDTTNSNDYKQLKISAALAALRGFCANPARNYSVEGIVTQSIKCANIFVEQINK